MDTFTPFDSNIDSFNRLPSYKQEPLFQNECIFDDGFGFDPPPTEQDMLDLYSDTTDSLSVPTYQIPPQLSPTSLLRQSSDLAPAPAIQDSTRPVVAPLSSAGGASPWSRYEDAVRKINDPTVRRKRARTDASTYSTPVKPGTKPTKRRRERRRQLSNTSQSSQKEQSLEKNRIAAAKCRTKKKEQNEQMLQDLRTKAMENKVLRDVIRRMKTELHIVTTFLLAYSDCTHCKKSEQLKDALRLVHEASTSESGDGSSSPGDNQGLSSSEISGSSISYGRSLEDTDFDTFMIGNGDIESPAYSEMLEA